MTANLKKELNRMGTGWFILKYAEDHGISIGEISTNYGNTQAMNARLVAYNRTKSEHDVIIKELQATGLGRNVKGGCPEVDLRVLEAILGKL